MLNQFNNINMGRGGEKYGADGLYNMDAVWNDEQTYRTFDRRPTKVSIYISFCICLIYEFCNFLGKIMITMAFSFL
jgi:hypothetical protein